MSEKGRGRHSQIATSLAWNNTDPRLLCKYPGTLLERTHMRDSEEAKLICQWQKTSHPEMLKMHPLRRASA